MTKKILAVDDVPNNLQILRQILRDSYQLIFAANGEKALEAAAKHHPDLILLDVMMPNMGGYEVCQKLKENPATRDIPVIFVTAMSEMEDEAQGFDAGAVDYILKPVSGPILLRRIQTQLSLVRAQELEASHRQAIFMLGKAGHYNDNDTGQHIWRMAAYARALAVAAGWPEQMAERLELAAPMHDTGKIGIPDSILKAPRALTPEEWKIMKRHTEIGHGIMNQSESPIFVMAAEIALCHHEKWDGSGYPAGLAGNDIPISARLMALADVFDALICKRVYKPAFTLDEARSIIVEGSAHHFDPDIVKAFLDEYPKFIHIANTWSD